MKNQNNNEEKRKQALNIAKRIQKLENPDLNYVIGDLIETYNLGMCERCDKIELDENLHLTSENTHTNTRYVLCKDCKKEYEKIRYLSGLQEFFKQIPKRK